jgi:hypothetical protein
MAAFSAALLGPVGSVLGQALSDDDLYRIPVESANDPLNYLIKAHFEPFIGTAFKAAIDGTRAVSFRLKAVDDVALAANAKRGYRGESFSLLFENLSDRRPAPGMYAFDHDTLGKFALMLVPVGKAGRNYEAVINRIGR